jgi:hypothetical protein
MSRTYLSGKFRAFVVDNQDPLKIGRVRVWCPDVATVDQAGNHIILEWASPCFQPGIIFVPKVGDGVWIEFVGGEIDRPVMTGRWFAVPKGMSQLDGEVIDGQEQSGFVQDVKLKVDDSDDAQEASMPVPQNDPDYPNTVIFGGNSGFLSINDDSGVVTLKHRKGHSITISNEGITLASNGRIRQWAVEDIEQVTDKYNTSTNDPMVRELRRIFKPSPKGEINIEIDSECNVKAKEFVLDVANGTLKFRNGKTELVAGPDRQNVSGDKTMQVMESFKEIIANYSGTLDPNPAAVVARAIEIAVGVLNLETDDGEINLVTGTGGGTQFVNLGAKVGTDFLLKVTQFLIDLSNFLTALSAWGNSVGTSVGVPFSPVNSTINAIQNAISSGAYATQKAKGI